jgi:hypothetical protein
MWVSAVMAIVILLAALPAHAVAGRFGRVKQNAGRILSGSGRNNPVCVPSCVAARKTGEKVSAARAGGARQNREERGPSPTELPPAAPLFPRIIDLDHPLRNHASALTAASRSC